MDQTSQPTKAPIFPTINADDTDQSPMEIESICVNCEENGITKLLLTKIPFYKEVILMSFECPHCGYRNCEIQSGSRVQETGIRLVVKIQTKDDLSRQVVKSEYAGVTIPEVEFEIPQHSQAGEITNVEGIVSRAIEGLNYGQAQRREDDPSRAEQIADFMQRLTGLLTLEKGFTLIIDDPSGNSFVGGANPLHVDSQITVIHYHRTLQQEKMLGFVADDVEEEESAPPIWECREEIRNEVLHFACNCPNCNAPAETNMKLVNIPYFKEVVIMATNCEVCGHRTAEAKSGCGIAEKGIKLTLYVSTAEDLKRDLLKSDTSMLDVPELELELGMGTLGGRFTTVEGLFSAIKYELVERGGFAFGDSAETSQRHRMQLFLEQLDEVLALKRPVHLILTDPAGNSYIQSLSESGPDSQLTIETFERTWEDKEELGLNDMKVENYAEEQTS